MTAATFRLILVGLFLFCVTSVSYAADLGSVNDYSVQDILVICSAWIAFCVGWVVGR